MRKPLFIFLILFTAPSLYGQQRNGLTQFFLIMQKDHPALVGADDFLQINVSYSQPWNDFTEDADNYSVSAFTPLGHSKAMDEVRRGPRISNEESIEAYSKLSSLRRRHGIGILAEGNNLGPQKELDLKAYYAYHIPVSDKFNLSLGTGLGVYQQEINLNDLTVRDPVNDEFYQQIISSGGKQTRFIADFGIALYAENIYFSITGKSLVEEELSGESLLTNFTREKGGSFLVGYKRALNDKLSVHLNGSVLYSELYDMIYMGAVRFKYDDFIYAGGSFHHDYKWSLLLGLNAAKNIYIHYAYDNHTGYINEFSRGTHQVTVGLSLINNFFKKPLSW